MRVQYLGTNKYIALVSCISNLFPAWHGLLQSQSTVHGCLLSTYSCGIRILFLMGMESGWCRLHCQPFSEAQLLELWYGVLEAVAHKGYLVKSCRPVWFGSPQANCRLYKYTEHSPLAAVSQSLSCFPHRFQVPVTLVPTIQPFCSASLVS